ncbi:hypothetical protein [Streptomyces sp. KL116D]
MGAALLLMAIAACTVAGSLAAGTVLQPARHSSTPSQNVEVPA